MAEKSARTKMIEEAPVSEDMGGLKRMVKKGAAAASTLMDRMGLTQKKEYEGKTKEELKVKKAKGGKVGYAKGGYVKAADGCAVKGKTKGRMV